MHPKSSAGSAILRQSQSAIERFALLLPTTLLPRRYLHNIAGLQKTTFVNHGLWKVPTMYKEGGERGSGVGISGWAGEVGNISTRNHNIKQAISKPYWNHACPMNC